MADPAGRQGAHRRQGRRAWDYLAGAGRAGADAGTVSPAGSGRSGDRRAVTRLPAVNLWVRGRKAARLPFGDVGRDLTRYPFLQIFPQDEHERLLVERLDSPRRASSNATCRADRLRRRAAAWSRRDCAAPTAAEQLCEAALYRRLRRRALGRAPGGRRRLSRCGTYRQLFYVADVKANGPPVDGELHVDLDEADFLGVFPLAGQGRARLIGTVRDERADHPETLRFEDVSARAITSLKLDVEQVNWFSTYHVHHRVTDRFRKGRAFLLGDAAHIHSPAGGQGMNTGIGDAINLAWKLAAVIAGRAPDSLLDSYEAERIGFARRLVATTDRVFSFVTAEGPLADVLRTRAGAVVDPGRGRARPG